MMRTMWAIRGSQGHLSLPSILFLLLAMVDDGHAHGGHTDKIPEGAAVSDDPIVCLDQ